MATTNNNPSYEYSDAPEVVPDQGSGLEPVKHSSLEPVQPEAGEAWKYAGGLQYSTLEPHPDNYYTSPEPWKQEATLNQPGSPGENTPALGDHGQPLGNEDGQTQGAISNGHLRKRRKWYAIGGAVAVLATIAIVLGCVLGLRKKNDSDSAGDNSASNRTSVCRNTICPQTIAVPQNYNDRLIIFARGADNFIHWRYAPDGGQGDWQPIPGVEFLSQPSSMAWNNGQVQVTAISSDEKSTGQRAARGNVFTTWIEPATSGATFQPWFNLGETAAGAAPMCVVPKDVWFWGYTSDQKGNVTVADRLDVWTVSTVSKTVVHNLWKPDSNVWMSPEQRTTWDAAGGWAQIVGSVPAVTCRDGAIQHDLLVYTPQGVARWHSYSNTTGNWSEWKEIPGTRFTGDPVTVAVGDDRWDFFGIDATSKVLQHARWTAEDGLSKLEAVGDLPLESVPSVIVSGSKHRIDVVALGQDDRVMHQALVGTSWNNEWEVVGDFVADSAPAVTNFKCDDTASDCTAVMVLLGNGTMSYAHWASTTSRSWNATLQWRNLGGNLTTEYMLVS